MGQPQEVGESIDDLEGGSPGLLEPLPAFADFRGDLSDLLGQEGHQRVGLVLESPLLALDLQVIAQPVEGKSRIDGRRGLSAPPLGEAAVVFRFVPGPMGHQIDFETVGQIGQIEQEVGDFESQFGRVEPLRVETALLQFGGELSHLLHGQNENPVELGGEAPRGDDGPHIALQRGEREGIGQLRNLAHPAAVR